MEQSSFSTEGDGDRVWDACLAHFRERTEYNSELFKVCTAQRVTDKQYLVSEVRSRTERNNRLEKEVQGLLTMNKELEQRTRSLEKELNEFRMNMVTASFSSVD
jgi:predicted  nucleic acid-binding Zn-ribbon protein